MAQVAYAQQVGYPVQFSVAYPDRWNVRVTAYALTLVTDRYPPFRLAP